MISSFISVALMIIGFPNKKARERDRRLLPVYLLLALSSLAICIVYSMGYFPAMSQWVSRQIESMDKLIGGTR